MNQINQPDKWRKNTLLFLNIQFLQAQSFHTSGSPNDKRVIWMIMKINELKKEQRAVLDKSLAASPTRHTPA